jgi:hypothetical protein
MNVAEIYRPSEEEIEDAIKDLKNCHEFFLITV